MVTETFLATISQSSAAMVAIIGGFVISKLISIQTDREGLLRRIKYIKKELRRIKKEYKDVYEYRLFNSKATFRKWVMEDLVKNSEKEINYENLAAEHIPRGSSIEEMVPYLKDLHNQVKEAEKLIINKINDSDYDDLDIYELEKRGLKYPEEEDDIYYEAVRHIASLLPKRPVSSFGSILGRSTVPFITPGSDGSTREINARRLDESIKEEASLKSQIESYEQELKHLEVELSKLSKPSGVYPAILVLSYVSLFGILLPTLLLSFNLPVSSNSSRNALMLLFANSLFLVIGYIFWYLKKLEDKD